MRVTSLTVSLPTMLALAACATAPPDPEPQPEYPVSGQIVNAADAPLPNFVSYVTIHPNALVFGKSPALAQVTEYDGQFLAIDSAPVDPDGTFQWDLGDGSDIPASYFALAAQAFQFSAPDVSCDLTASKAVPVLRVFFNANVMLPFGVLGALSDGGDYAHGRVHYTDLPSLEEPSGTPYRLGAWIYAAEDVTIQGTCVLDDGVVPPITVAEIDVALAAGWSPITYFTDPGEGLVTITSGTFEGSWLLVLTVGPM